MDGWGGSHFRRETGFSGLQIQEPQPPEDPRGGFPYFHLEQYFLPPYDHDDQQPGRKRGVFYQTVGQPVSFFYRDLDEIYIRGFLIIIEGPFYISVEIDHLKLVRYPGKKGALNGNGHQDNAEYQIKQVVFHGDFIEHHQYGEHNRSNAPKAGPGGYADLPHGRAERRQDQEYA